MAWKAGLVELAGDAATMISAIWTISTQRTTKNPNFPYLMNIWKTSDLRRTKGSPPCSSCWLFWSTTLFLFLLSWSENPQNSEKDSNDLVTLNFTHVIKVDSSCLKTSRHMSNTRDVRDPTLQLLSKHSSSRAHTTKWCWFTITTCYFRNVSAAFSRMPKTCLVT